MAAEPRVVKEVPFPLEGGYTVVNKALCHATFGGDVALPCQHRCSYCYAETFGYVRVRFKVEEPDILHVYTDLPDRLDRLFSRHEGLRYPYRFGIFGDVTIPYERTSKVLGGCMEVARRHGWPIVVFTKVPIHRWVEDEMLRLAEDGLLHVSVTITTFDEGLRRAVEPNAPRPEDRAELLEWCRDHGVSCALRVTPLFQGLTDSEEAFASILDRCPRGHVVVEYVRCQSKELRDWLASLGVVPWSYTRPFYTAPRDYAKERFLKLRNVAHRRGWSFAVCGHYVGFKVQDHRDCCSGPNDFYGKFMPYEPARGYLPRIRELIARVPETPLMRWRGPDHNLAAMEAPMCIETQFLYSSYSIEATGCWLI